MTTADTSSATGPAIQPVFRHSDAKPTFLPTKDHEMTIRQRIDELLTKLHDAMDDRRQERALARLQAAMVKEGKAAADVKLLASKLHAAVYGDPALK